MFAYQKRPQNLCCVFQALGRQSGDNNNWPGTLALVHSYITHKTGEYQCFQELSLFIPMSHHT